MNIQLYLKAKVLIQCSSTFMGNPTQNNSPIFTRHFHRGFIAAVDLVFMAKGSRTVPLLDTAIAGHFRTNFDREKGFPGVYQ